MDDEQIEKLKVFIIEVLVIVSAACTALLVAWSCLLIYVLLNFGEINKAVIFPETDPTTAPTEAQAPHNFKSWPNDYQIFGPRPPHRDMHP